MEGKGEPVSIDPKQICGCFMYLVRLFRTMYEMDHENGLRYLDLGLAAILDCKGEECYEKTDINRSNTRSED